jgi:hypothetical protein
MRRTKRFCVSSLMGFVLVACGTDVGELREQDEVIDDTVADPIANEDDETPVGGGGTTPPTTCPAFPPAAVLVTVGTEGEGAVCDAVVEIRDGDFVRIAQRGGPADACMYFSVFERAGTYDVVVSHEAYAPVTVGGVVVVLDACGHAITSDVAVSLSGPSAPVDDVVEPEPVVDEPEPDSDPGSDPGDPVPDPEPAFVCPPDEAAYTGDVVLDSAGALDVLDGIVCVAGHVFVEGAIDSIALPTLRRVMGHFSVDEASSLETLNLPALEVVLGDLTLRGTAIVDLDGLDALRTVGGALSIENNGDLEVADLGVTSAGSLALVDNPVLVQARLRTLAAVASVDIRENTDLDDMDLRAVASVSGDMILEGAVFADLDLRLLSSVGGSFVLARASDIDAFDQMAELASVGGDLTIRELPAMADDDAAAFVDGVLVGGVTLVCGLDGGDACP